MANQLYFGADKSATCFGVGYKSWNVKDLHAILQFYGVKSSMKTAKNILMNRLTVVAEEHEITRDDCLDQLRSPKVTADRSSLVRDCNKSVYCDDESDGDESVSDCDATDDASEPTDEITLSDEDDDLVQCNANYNLQTVINSDGRATRVCVCQLFVPKQILIIKRKSSHDNEKALRRKDARCTMYHHSLDESDKLRPPTEACCHPTKVCVFCLKTYIADQVNTAEWDQINCPTCFEDFQDADFRYFADPQTLQRYHHSKLLVYTYSLGT